MWALVAATLLAQNLCEPPWRSLGSTLEDLRYDGERIIVCAHNGGAYPPPKKIAEACVAIAVDGGVSVAALPTRASTRRIDSQPDGGLQSCLGGGCVAILTTESAEFYALNEAGTQLVLALPKEARVGVFDAVSGRRISTLDPTTKKTACVGNVGFVGALVYATSNECEGNASRTWFFDGTRRTPAPDFHAEFQPAARQVDADLTLVLAKNTLHRVRTPSGVSDRLIALPALEGCQFDGCRKGYAPLFGLLVTGTLSTDVTPIAIAPDGGIAVISSSAWAQVNVQTGVVKNHPFPLCPEIP